MLNEERKPKTGREITPYVNIQPLHSFDYLKKISIKINVTTNEGNSQNEI